MKYRVAAFVAAACAVSLLAVAIVTREPMADTFARHDKAQDIRRLAQHADSVKAERLAAESALVVARQRTDAQGAKVASRGADAQAAIRAARAAKDSAARDSLLADAGRKVDSLVMADTIYRLSVARERIHTDEIIADLKQEVADAKAATATAESLVEDERKKGQRAVMHEQARSGLGILSASGGAIVGAVIGGPAGAGIGALAGGLLSRVIR